MPPSAKRGRTLLKHIAQRKSTLAERQQAHCAEREHQDQVRRSLSVEDQPVHWARLSYPEPHCAKPDMPKTSRPNMAAYATSGKVTQALRLASLSEESRRTLRMPTLANDAFYRRHANISPEEKDMTIHNRPAVPLQDNGIPLRGRVYAPTLGHYAPSEKKNK